jgi:hypothetical protein
VKIQEVELEAALVKARWIAEYVVNSVLEREGLTARAKGELLHNIELLGTKEEKFTKQRGGRPPVLPPPVYQGLHTARIYGNFAVTPTSRGRARPGMSASPRRTTR